MDALCGALSSIAALVKGPVLNAMKERIAAATVKWQTKAAAAVRRAAPFELEPRAPERLLDGRQVVRQDAEAPASK